MFLSGITMLVVDIIKCLAYHRLIITKAEGGELIIVLNI